MKLDLDDLSVVESSIDKMVLSIESSSCSKVPFMWQLLEAVLTKPGQLYEQSTQEYVQLLFHGL